MARWLLVALVALVATAGCSMESPLATPGKPKLAGRSCERTATCQEPMP